MVDPTSVAVVISVLSAVGDGIAGEAGKWNRGPAGSLARRIAGREVPAPAEAVSQWLRVAPQAPTGGPVAFRFPVSTRFLTDRRSAVKQLGRAAARKSDGRPRVALLHGPESIGASALAVHWGCREVERFPDGQLYADLRGDSAEGAPTAATVLGAFLRQLGVPADELPPSAEERSALFRALVADRRLLVVLDQAHSAAQVRPLLSSAPAVLTIVVSNRAVLGLDAVRIPVGPPVDEDAVRPLTDLRRCSRPASADPKRARGRATALAARPSSTSPVAPQGSAGSAPVSGSVEPPWVWSRPWTWTVIRTATGCPLWFCPS